MEQYSLSSERQWIHEERRLIFIHCILLDTYTYILNYIQNPRD